MHSFSLPAVQPFDVEYIYGFVWWGVCKQSRWRHSVTEPEPEPEPSQDGGYVLLWQRYDNNKMVAMRYYGNVILHLQQYSHRLKLFFEVMFDFPGDIQSEKHSYTAFKPNRILTESCGIFRSIFSCSDINTGFVTNCWASALSPEIRYGKGYRMIAIQLVTPLFLPLSHL